MFSGGTIKPSNKHMVKKLSFESLLMFEFHLWLLLRFGDDDFVKRKIRESSCFGVHNDSAWIILYEKLDSQLLCSIDPFQK